MSARVVNQRDGAHNASVRRPLIGCAGCCAGLRKHLSKGGEDWLPTSAYRRFCVCFELDFDPNRLMICALRSGVSETLRSPWRDDSNDHVAGERAFGQMLSSCRGQLNGVTRTP